MLTGSRCLAVPEGENVFLVLVHVLLLYVPVLLIIVVTTGFNFHGLFSLRTLHVFPPYYNMDTGFTSQAGPKVSHAWYALPSYL